MLWISIILSVGGSLGMTWMHEFLGSNKYAVGNGKQNCFLLLETENLKAKQSMCSQIFVWETIS